MASDNIRLGLEMLMREAELESGNLTTVRGNIAVLTSLALTVDAIIASKALDQWKSGDSFALPGLAVGLTVAFLVLSVYALRLRDDSIPWPSGAQVSVLSSPATDAMRDLIVDFGDKLNQTRNVVRDLQRWVVVLLVAFVLSVGAWLWMLAATGDDASSVPSPSSTSVVQTTSTAGTTSAGQAVSTVDTTSTAQTSIDLTTVVQPTMGTDSTAP